MTQEEVQQQTLDEMHEELIEIKNLLSRLIQLLEDK